MNSFRIRALTPTACLVMLITGLMAHAPGYAQDGDELYETHCASCHNGRVAKAPPRTLLAIMSGSSILRAMETGIMQSQASALSPEEKKQVASYLTGEDPTHAAVASSGGQCEAADGTATVPRPDTLGWGVNHRNERHFDASTTSIEVSDLDKLELKWAFAYPDASRARSQPAVAGDTLFVGSQNGNVYALNKHSGCIEWTFSTVAEVRTGIVVSPELMGTSERRLLFFGDLIGNIYAIDARDGQLVWRDRPDDHPSLTLTAAPALHDGVLYVPLSSLEVTEAADPEYACCTFRGGVAAYDAASGKRLWTGYTIADAPAVVGKNSVGTDRIAPSGAPVWNTPSVDVKRQRLYVGTGENYSSPANGSSDAIVALDMRDGSILWVQQTTAKDAWNMGCETDERINCPPEDGPDYDFGAATIIAQTADGKDMVIAGQKSGDVYALNPDKNGEILWHRKLGRGGIQGGVHFGMAVDGETLYVPMSDFNGGPRWPGTPKPGMFALELESGETRWYAPDKDHCAGREYCQPGISGVPSSLSGGVLAGGMDGVLRAYAKNSGELVWSYDTATRFDSVNAGVVSGGSIGGATGPVLSGNMLFVNSGYGIYFHMPGNVLLGFAIKDDEPH